MTALEKVMQLRKQGTPESEIIQNLQGQGYSPKEIDDSINQSQIKQAVAGEPQNENMQASLLKNPEAGGVPAPQQGQPLPEDPYAPQDQYQPQYPPQMSSPSQNQYSPEPQYEGVDEQPQEYYEEPQEGYSAIGTETIIEISEQVFSEKIKKLEKPLKELTEFKTIYQSRIDDMNDRLKRIEKQFDKMQIAILDKVGSFGKGIQKVEKELDMIEDSFGKIMKKHK